MTDVLRPPSPAPNESMRDRWVYVAGAAIGLLFLVAVLDRCRDGFDFTDEGFYLNWIASPRSYAASLTQFGFIYHPLYRLVGCSPVLLRQANVLITLALTGALCLGLVRRWVPARDGIMSHDRYDYVLAGVMATSSLASLLYSYLWVPTPSYNSLAFQSLLVAAIALFVVYRDDGERRAMGGVVLGLAGWLALMAKPTTAVALGLLCVVYLVLARRLAARLVVAALASVTALTSASALALDGSFTRFGSRLLAAMQDDRLLSGGHSFARMFRLDSLSLDLRERVALGTIALVAFLAAALGAGGGRLRRTAWGLIVLGAGVLAAVLCTSIWSGGPAWLAPVLTPVTLPGLRMAAVAAGSIAAVVALRQRTEPYHETRSRVAAALFLAACPGAYLLGTGVNYWVAASNVAVFWLMACVPIVGLLNAGRSRGALLSTALAGQCVAIAVVCTGFDFPYRQSQPLRLDADYARLAPGGARLKLSKPSARYLLALRTLAAKHGFADGTPVIDLTGHYPGALYALGSRPLGHAWILGGYPGSGAFAIAGLDREDCSDLAGAWVLEEPRGPRALNSEILRRYGIDPERDLEVVGELASPTEDYPVSYLQRLSKPRRAADQAEAACRTARRRVSAPSAP